jgi:hypothetical protein
LAIDITPQPMADTYIEQARSVMDKLAEVRAHQRYCHEAAVAKRAAPWRDPEDRIDAATPALDALECDLVRQLADLHRRFGIQVQ